MLYDSPCLKRTHAKSHILVELKRFSRGAESVKMAPGLWEKWINFGPFTPNTLHIRSKHVDTPPTPTTPTTTTRRGKGPFSLETADFIMGVRVFRATALRLGSGRSEIQMIGMGKLANFDPLTANILQIRRYHVVRTTPTTTR